jgi:hypothetical protein
MKVKVQIGELVLPAHVDRQSIGAEIERALASRFTKGRALVEKRPGLLIADAVIRRLEK